MKYAPVRFMNAAPCNMTLPWASASWTPKLLLYTYHLISEKQDSLEGEFAVAEVEEVLERGTKKVDDHGIVVALLTVPTDERDTDTTGKGLVDLGLVLELRVLGLDGLELDSDLLTGDDVDAEVNVTERSGTDLLTDTVLAADTEIHDCCEKCGSCGAEGCGYAIDSAYK